MNILRERCPENSSSQSRFFPTRTATKRLTESPLETRGGFSPQIPSKARASNHFQQHKGQQSSRLSHCAMEEHTGV